MYYPNEKTELINMAQEVSRSFLDFSMSVVIPRALSDARDELSEGWPDRGQNLPLNRIAALK